MLPVVVLLLKYEPVFITEMGDPKQIEQSIYTRGIVAGKGHIFANSQMRKEARFLKDIAKFSFAGFKAD